MATGGGDARPLGAVCGLSPGHSELASSWSTWTFSKRFGPELCVAGCMPFHPSSVPGGLSARCASVPLRRRAPTPAPDNIHRSSKYAFKWSQLAGRLRPRRISGRAAGASEIFGSSPVDCPRVIVQPDPQPVESRDTAGPPSGISTRASSPFVLPDGNAFRDNIRLDEGGQA